MIKERLSAHYLYHQEQLIKRATIEMDENRNVVSVIDRGGMAVELASMRYLNGILIPLKENSAPVLNQYAKQVEEYLAKVGDMRVISFIEDLVQNNIDTLQSGRIIAFGLLKGVDYKTMHMKSPVQIVPVRWLY